MATDGDIIPEMEVYGSDSVHVGSVDAVDGARIRLNTVASSVPVDGDQRHYVLIDDVERVEGNRVHMSMAGVECVHSKPGAAADYADRGAIEPGGTLNR